MADKLMWVPIENTGLFMLEGCEKYVPWIGKNVGLMAENVPSKDAVEAGLRAYEDWCDSSPETLVMEMLKAAIASGWLGSPGNREHRNHHG